MKYQAPKDIWEVQRLLSFDESLDPDDPKYVHLEKGRGDFSFHRLLKDLGVDPGSME